MTPERWRKVEEIVHSALSRVESERIAFLDHACGGDASLRREVESLLAQQASTGDFLESPAVADPARMIGEDDLSMLTGRRLGPYQVHERIGAGGMGEVYRARDTKLGRDVAIKILPSLFTSDPGRLARFEREARVLASLNHPHVGAIYGLEDADGVRALVLELVNGETLADRIARGPIALTDALTIAQQIVDALDAAHEKGIIHRDLKPANIKMTPDGSVKVLDFGLAKAASSDAAPADLTQSTPTVGGTREGIILGTAPYMSPEQARGLSVDKRTDIWAFGCVLYEMLTGATTFRGDTVSDTIATILEREPNWKALPSTTPTPIRKLLRRCLEKDRKRRLDSATAARLEIEDALAAPDAETVAAAPSRRAAPVAIVALAGIALVALIALWAPWRAATEPPRTVRFDVYAPVGATIVPGQPLSPDGRTLAFVASTEGPPMIWVRTPRFFRSARSSRHRGRLRHLLVAGQPVHRVFRSGPTQEGCGDWRPARRDLQ